MKKTLKMILGIILLIIICCTSKFAKDTSIPIINIKSNIKNERQINISQFTDNIKYFPIGKSREFYFSGIVNYNFFDNLIVVNNLDLCLLFRSNGDFITKVGSRGRGPGEFQFANNVRFAPDSNILVQSLYDLFEFNLDGSFLNSYSNVFLNKGDYISKWSPIDDSLLFGKIASVTGSEQCKAVIFNRKGKVKFCFKNYFQLNRKGSWMGDSEEDASISFYQKQLFFKEIFNDTLFCLSEQYKLLPKFVFDLGSFAQPPSERVDFDEAVRKEADYIQVRNIFQTEKHLFIDCFFGSQFSARRLTPKMINIGDKEIENWYNTKRVLWMFDRQTKKLGYSKPTSTDNPLFTSGLYNDIDAGPRFFPLRQINDSTMVMVVEAKQLKDHIASNEFKNVVPKYPEKKKELEKLGNTLTEFDNPILMFVTFNK